MAHTMQLLRGTAHVAAILQEDGDTKDILLCSIELEDYENTELFTKYFKPNVLKNVEPYDILVMHKDKPTLYLADTLFHDYPKKNARIIEDELNYNIYLSDETNINTLTLGVKVVSNFLDYIKNELLV